MNTELVTAPEALEALRAALKRTRAAILRPPPTMSLPEWADTYRHLSASAGANAGRWRTERVEVARGPMSAITERGVRRVTVMTCTQILKSSLIENVFGYYAHLDPCPMLLIQPKDEAVDAFSKERIAPMVKCTPVLREIMGDRKARTSEDTLRFKTFPGGFLALSSAGSPTNLAMRAIRVTLLDEVDKYEATREGDPVILAEERTSTFTTSALSIRACSPTIEETSRIFASYKQGDQRRAFAECPHCGEWLDLDFWRHVSWDKTDSGDHMPETAAIYCDHCGAEWSEAERFKVVSTRGKVRHFQTRPFKCCGETQDPKIERLWVWDDEAQCGYAQCKHCHREAVPNTHASFQVSKLFSPFTSVVEIVEKWLDAKDSHDTKQTFYNTILGLPFKSQASKELSVHYLAGRRELYQAEVPEPVVLLTAGFDVQADRIEGEVVGWGLGEESWSIDTPAFYGPLHMPDIWAALDDYLQRDFRHESGVNMRLMASCIDSGGHSTNEVYAFARTRFGRNVWAIKGASDKGGQWSAIWPPLVRAGKYRPGQKPVIIGVNLAKEAVRARLGIEAAGPGFCHFPHDRAPAWFEQLTAENLIVERRGGRAMRRWVLPRGRANEALDCRAYAYAALHGLYHARRVDLAKHQTLVQSAIEQHTNLTETEAELLDEYRPPKPVAPIYPQRRIRGRMI
jgi:phage terminase large subunit GpA-like protein